MADVGPAERMSGVHAGEGVTDGVSGFLDLVRADQADSRCHHEFGRVIQPSRRRLGLHYADPGHEVIRAIPRYSSGLPCWGFTRDASG